MRPFTPAKLPSLATLFEAKRGKVLPLPSGLARVYGCLRMPLPSARPYVYSNFVTTIDGVVSFKLKGHASGGDISGFSDQDRMVMGLLRAVADVIVIGSGTLRADRRHVWTAEAIFPQLADEYLELRHALGKYDAPLNVVVSGKGNVDLRLPVFGSGKVPTMIVTTTAGARLLCKQHIPDCVEIRVARRGAGAIPASAILDEVCRTSKARRILVEGGPRLLGDFFAERLIDEQFLTLAPQIAGREAGDRRLSLVMGQLFTPSTPLWGKLVDVRRGERLLFLRYSFS
jgi:riboflavin biosynthesis pyrimidine reductase